MTSPDDLALQLSALDAMTTGQLRERYRELWGDDIRTGNRRFLIKRITWKLQANAEGDLPERARRRALELARDSDLRTTAPKLRPGPRATAGPTVVRAVPVFTYSDPSPGSQLVRPYKGRTVVVDVLEDGFAWEGQRYGSLSAVARALTGSHLSGRAFFKLKGTQGALA